MKDHELIIVGDRIFTDVIMANRIRKASQAKWRPPPLKSSTGLLEEKNPVEPEQEVVNGPLAIWTTSVWKREAMVMRYLEHSLVKAVDKWSTPEHFDSARFRKPEPPVELEVKKAPWYSKYLSRFLSRS